MNEKIKAFHALKRKPQSAKRHYANGSWAWNPSCLHCHQVDESIAKEDSCFVCNNCKQIIDHYIDNVKHKLCSINNRQRTYMTKFHLDEVQIQRVDDCIVHLNMTTRQFNIMRKDIDSFLRDIRLSEYRRNQVNFTDCVVYNDNQALAIVNHNVEFLTADYKSIEKQLMDEYASVGGYLLVEYNTALLRYNLYFVIHYIKEC